MKYDIMELCNIMTINVYTHMLTSTTNTNSSPGHVPRLSGGRLRVAMPRVVSLHLRRHHETSRSVGQWVGIKLKNIGNRWKPMESMLFFIGNHKNLCRKPFICFSTWYPISSSPTLQMLLWAFFLARKPSSPWRNPCSCKPGVSLKPTHWDKRTSATNHKCCIPPIPPNMGLALWICNWPRTNNCFECFLFVYLTLRQFNIAMEAMVHL